MNFHWHPNQAPYNNGGTDYGSFVQTIQLVQEIQNLIIQQAQVVYNQNKNRLENAKNNLDHLRQFSDVMKQCNAQMIFNALKDGYSLESLVPGNTVHNEYLDAMLANWHSASQGRTQISQSSNQHAYPSNASSQRIPPAARPPTETNLAVPGIDKQRKKSSNGETQSNRTVFIFVDPERMSSVGDSDDDEHVHDENSNHVGTRHKTVESTTGPVLEPPPPQSVPSASAPSEPVPSSAMSPGSPEFTQIWSPQEMQALTQGFQTPKSSQITSPVDSDVEDSESGSDIDEPVSQYELKPQKWEPVMSEYGRQWLSYVEEDERQKQDFVMLYLEKINRGQRKKKGSLSLPPPVEPLKKRKL